MQEDAHENAFGLRPNLAEIGVIHEPYKIHTIIESHMLSVVLMERRGGVPLHIQVCP